MVNGWGNDDKISKTLYHINEILTCGTDKIQKKLSLIAGGHNLKNYIMNG